MTDNSIVENTFEYNDIKLHAEYSSRSINGSQISPSFVGLFIHGLGGNHTQFSDIYSHFPNYITLDFIGHGKSGDSDNASDYTTDEIVKSIVAFTPWALTQLTTRFPDAFPSNSNIPLLIISHSYGGILSTLVFNSFSSTIPQSLQFSPVGIVYLGPKVILRDGDLFQINYLCKTPDFVFEIFRFLDKWGGINSASVSRVISSEASDEVRARQLEYNLASRTRTIKNVALGMRTVTPEEYKKVHVPILLVGGKHDTVTPVTPELETLRTYVTIPDSHYHILNCGHGIMLEKGKEVVRLISEFIKTDLKL